MAACPECKKEMEKGVFVSRAIGKPAVSQVYWCKKEGFFKAEDKVNISSSVAGTGGNKSLAYICKSCKNILIKY